MSGRHDHADDRIYLDNAATSWPKPEAVYDAVDRYQREIGAPNGRSGYREALEANRIVERARQGVAELIGVDDPSQIVFGFNGTDVLNLAIRGVVRPGDHVVTTVCEHNSVLRPLRALREHRGRRRHATCRATARGSFRRTTCARRCGRTRGWWPSCMRRTSPARFSRSRRSAASCARADALFLVDAAQSLGHVPIDVADIRRRSAGRAGHKGLLGPLGTGVLYIRPGVERELQPLRYGGTGTQSDEDRQPDELPDKYEPGNHNLPGLAGLAPPREFLRKRNDRGDSRASHAT